MWLGFGELYADWPGLTKAGLGIHAVHRYAQELRRSLWFDQELSFQSPEWGPVFIPLEGSKKGKSDVLGWQWPGYSHEENRAWSIC